jgi:hypothetical protein
MAKRPLYAVAELAVAAAALVTVFAAPADGRTFPPEPTAQSAVCATCIAISISADAAVTLPAPLDGLDVFVRVAAAEEGAAAAALTEIERKGGRPGLLIAGLSGAAPTRTSLERVRRIVLLLSARLPAQTEEEFAFALKSRLTAVRAAGPDTASLGIAADAPTLSSLLSREIGSYVDFVVAAEPAPLAPGLELWRMIPAAAASVADVLGLTKTPGVTRWIWSLPATPAAAGALATELARVAALPPAADPLEPAAPGRFGEGVDVVGSRSLSVEEIVARHQAAAARQAAAVRTVIAAGTLTLSFEAPGFPAPITISSQATIYSSPDVTEIEQRAIRINGIEFRGSAVPRLPIIEPERVASPPLAIALTDVYRYQLAGRATVGGTLCYTVRFEPDPARPNKSQALFSGQAWIAADTFAMLKVSATQTGLRGAIVASEQVDEFTQVQPGIWLLGRSDVRQMYEGAAHRTPIHRVLAIASHEVNATDFSARRQSAHSSGSVMLRDTPGGYRYLKKEPSPDQGTPALAGRADRVRALTAGVIVDPNISVPLPFAGLSYVDFNFLGTGSQINAFFGGTYGQLAFSVPSLGGSRWQLAGRGFGIASSYNDRSFVQGRERYDEDLRQRPAHASVWLLRPLTPRISLRVGYDLDYTHLAAGEATAPDFIVPADQVVHGARLSIDAQREGWNGSAWWNPARRTGWRAWGRTGSGAYQASHEDFQRYGLSIARARVINPRLVARVEAAWTSGRDLDRFSRYSFGTFDNRLRGYPSALIRYDRGGVVRTALAWGASKLIRVDGFVDSAAVHDPGFGDGLRNYTGIGGAVEAPSPFGTLIAIEWGYGIRGVNNDGTLGTQVLRISGYKVF